MMKYVLIELQNADPTTLERLVLITARGFLRGIIDGDVVPDEAEAILLKPAVFAALEQAALSPTVLDLIHQGFFLDDVLQHLGPEALASTAASMEQVVKDLLLDRPYPGRHLHASPVEE
ncbi:DUF3969 family protein [Deinococcus sonorensis]|uniref:DUF3969 family protein n=1 Tax=Deinococcus sonorensis TaxID=309891 RepID=A0ABV8YBG3_9DEIO